VDYRYLVLVVTGFVLSIMGFVMLGRGRHGHLPAGLVFLAGVVSLILGILLTCVPGFFKP
jgi:hypothetical protein